MPDESHRHWRFRITDILEAIERCEKFTSGLAAGDSPSDGPIYWAVLQQLQIIGEAANNLPRELRDRYPYPWRKMIGMRNRIAHNYFAIEEDVVWLTVREDIAPLKALLEEILAREPPD
jgi:uncharacterized protein with HEPN domain